MQSLQQQPFAFGFPTKLANICLANLFVKSGRCDDTSFSFRLQRAAQDHQKNRRPRQTQNLFKILAWMPLLLSCVTALKLAECRRQPKSGIDSAGHYGARDSRDRRRRWPHAVRAL